MRQNPDETIFKLKSKIRQNRFLFFLATCPYRSPKWDKKVKELISELGPKARGLDLGSGSKRRGDHIINLEIDPSDKVDVVADGHQLPFVDNAFDIVIIEAVLEHVLKPEAIVSEVNRVLKVGGYACAAVPFLQPYHPSPLDNQRYTLPGFEALFSNFENFEKLESGACVGPTTTLHWIFREYVGFIFSFGQIWLAKVISLIVGWVTFPLVFLDYLLLRRKDAHMISSAVYFIGRKKAI